MSFDRLIPDARGFLRNLSQNNTRAWFNDNKSTYEDTLKNPSLHLLDQISARLSQLTNSPTTTKLFRPHRDLRFSKDKTPYHTHLHLLWSSAEGSQWFFGVSPDYITAGGGRMGFDKDTLTRYRAALPTYGAALLTEIDRLKTEGAHQRIPEMKRPAAPITADDPLADLARRKSLSVWMDYDEPVTDLPKRLEETFTRLWPLQQALGDMLTS